MADLYLVCGISGAGKSTFLKNQVHGGVVVSRDQIRFSIVKSNEEYFSHEKEVYEEFWGQITQNLMEGKDVFADQTSLTPKSRKYLIDNVKGYEHIYAIWIDEDLDTCLERNENRKGTRAYVPQKVIIRMSSQFVRPSLSEGFHRIYHYNSKINKISYIGAPFSKGE